MLSRNHLALSLGCAVLACGGTVAHAADPAVDFARDVRPILAQHCWTCHGPDEKAREAELRLDRREHALAKKAIVPGDAKASKLVGRIESSDAKRVMPPPTSKKPLTERQKQILRSWIEQGAAYAQHWAFVAPSRPAIPVFRGDRQEIRNPIDAFVRHRLDGENVSPAPQADRATLLRRVTLDLTGLPPTPPELDAFLADSSADADEKAIDRLLATPAYAERMAMAWLDAARYADTNGFNNDEDRTQWPWRDWLIAAFARNLPYDRFVVEQLAGDLLPAATLDQKVATAFLRNQVHNTEGGIIPEEYRVEYVADRVHTTATVFLGLSLQCARCHDHKYDPVTQREYYQFFAFFNNVLDTQAGYSNFVAAEPFIRVPTTEQRERFATLADRRRELEARIRDRGPEAEKSLNAAANTLLPNEIVRILAVYPPGVLANAVAVVAGKRAMADPGRFRQSQLVLADTVLGKWHGDMASLGRETAEVEKAVPAVMVMQEMPKPRDAFVLKRGAYDHPGEKVLAGVPAVLPALGRASPGVNTSRSPNRRDLAEWLVRPEHPLTARVAVNRWWQMYFGTGLVKTVEDFGATGELPSHPELLDFLATELVRTGWDVKAMQKLIVTSATYRQSSRMTKQAFERDPENRLLARGPRHRLSAETVRDNALAIGGLLAGRVGGPSVKPYQPAGLWEDVTVERKGRYVPDTGEGRYRRSMYTFWKRTCPPPGLATFDAPNREVCVARRATTNTPLQALVLLNDPTYVEAARRLAERMLAQGGPTIEGRLAFAFRSAVARPPTAEEGRILTTILNQAMARFQGDKAAANQLLAVGSAQQGSKIDPVELAAWTMVASTILNLDETISKR